MMTTLDNEVLELGRRLNEDVLLPMKSIFIGKDEIIDLLGICLVGRENLFLLGPPGTAKSALVNHLCERLEGQSFVYLLTRFTEPNELFGPFDIRRLREGELATNTSGMLPEASLVFLDEIMNANSAVLNSLLTVLNEKTLRRGREIIPIEALMFVGASNHLPQEDALKALFDRFLLRVYSDNVAAEQLLQILHTGWNLERGSQGSASIHFREVQQLQQALMSCDLEPIRGEYVELVHRIRHAGIPLSDRRAVKLQRLIAASALLCGRAVAQLSDLWILRHIWEAPEQQEVLKSLVQPLIDKDTSGGAHPAARDEQHVNAEALARDLQWIHEQLAVGAAELTPGREGYLRDRLSLLDERCQWVREDTPRAHLQAEVAALWARLQDQPAGTATAAF